MRITEIIVEGLFNKFDHKISLNLEDQITIIHAPNGFGKTVLLKMVDGLLNFNLEVFRKVPFKNFRIAFDNKKKIDVTPDPKELFDKSKKADIQIKYDNESYEYGIDDIRKSMGRRQLIPLRVIERTIPELSQVGPNTWFDVSSQEKLSLVEVIERYYDYLPTEITDSFTSSTPHWFLSLTEALKVHLIQTQRLLLTSPDRGEYSKRKQHFTRSVSKYSQELSDTIKSKLSEYASKAQELDRSFPKRLLSPNLNKLSKEEINTRLTDFEEKRNKLKEVGLWDITDDMNFQLTQAIDDSSVNTLSLYVQDIEEKLRVFDDLAEKIDLFRDILNRRFLYKNLSISRQKGFTFSTEEGETLSPDDLSSGEQHQLVLLYEMLFKVASDSLIMIDEPEISLHIVWQEQFLSDLQKIIALSEFDVLLATHSPQIIGDRWDLTVELKGKEKE